MRNALRLPTLMFDFLLLPAVVGCGQSLSVRVERIATVPASEVPAYALASPEQQSLTSVRVSVAEMCVLTQSVADQVSQNLQGSASTAVSTVP